VLDHGPSAGHPATQHPARQHHRIRPTNEQEHDMTAGNTTTITGNLTSDPTLRILESGNSVANFTVAVTDRIYDRTTGEWKDGATAFIRCTAWRNAGAENIVDSMTKGTRVLVTGKLRQHTYTTDSGEQRTSTELEADEVGLSLRFATATAKKTTPATTTS
jgi:single-strand DNA-binding protein